MEAVYKSLTKEVEKLQEVEGNIQKRLQAYQQLAGQLSENENVEKDLEELTEDNKVFKLIGPVLVEQSLEEARDTVKKRLKFIQDEMKRNDEMMKTMEKERDSHREQIAKLQQRFQQEQTKAALKA
ncbi:Prefoldin subunit 6 [Taenia crassiceps]|uniref:Prefoldin subunit 6 n=1 Tax=Taenia crassiceps TaxID=6207 RepID=A0ABR4Q5I2_9CEST